MEFCSRDRRYVTSQGFPFFTNDVFYTLMHLLVGGGGGAGLREVGKKRAGRGRSKGAGIRREMQNANFCHLLSVQVLSKTRTQNVI